MRPWQETLNLKNSEFDTSVEQQLLIFLASSQPENDFCSLYCSEVWVALLRAHLFPLLFSMVGQVLGREEHRSCFCLNTYIFLRFVSTFIGIAALLATHEKLTDYYIVKYSKRSFFCHCCLALSFFYLQSCRSKETSDRLTDCGYFYTVHILTVE